MHFGFSTWICVLTNDTADRKLITNVPYTDKRAANVENSQHRVGEAMTHPHCCCFSAQPETTHLVRRDSWMLLEVSLTYRLQRFKKLKRFTRRWTSASSTHRNYT